MIRVLLPPHLRTLAHVDGELNLEIEGPATQRSVLDALELRYPMLRGTIRDQVTQERRPFLRFFACEQDLSNELPDSPLPDAVVRAAEPLLVIGAIAGGSCDFRNSLLAAHSIPASNASIQKQQACTSHPAGHHGAPGFRFNPDRPTAIPKPDFVPE